MKSTGGRTPKSSSAASPADFPASPPPSAKRTQSFRRDVRLLCPRPFPRADSLFVQVYARDIRLCVISGRGDIEEAEKMFGPGSEKMREWEARRKGVDVTEAAHIIPFALEKAQNEMVSPSVSTLTSIRLIAVLLAPSHSSGASCKISSVATCSPAIPVKLSTRLRTECCSLLQYTRSKASSE